MKVLDMPLQIVFARARLLNTLLLAEATGEGSSLLGSIGSQH